MTYHQQALYVSDPWGNPTEVINGYRTMQTLDDIGSCGANQFANVLGDAGNAALAFGPCGAYGHETTADETYTWQALALGATNAPWYDNSSDSINAFGILVTEWTGLDSEHTQRAVSPLGGTPGGARFGPSRSKHRVMKLNVLLFGANERALNFLFYWLEDQLRSCCACAEPTMWTRLYEPTLSTVPTAADLERGWVQMRDVVLIEGMTWESQPTPSSGQVMRQASFTIAAGDPCLYERVNLTGADHLVTGMATTSHAASAGTTESACNTFLNSASKASLAVVLPQPPYGEVCPTLKISSTSEFRSDGTRKSLPDLRITGYLDPNSTYTPGRVTDPDRCGLLKTGELILSGAGTSGLRIDVDLAAREIRYNDPLRIDGEWSDGSWMVGRATSRLRRWWGIPRCPGQGLVVVEPLYSTLINSSDYTLYALSDAITSWTIGWTAYRRYGCC